MEKTVLFRDFEERDIDFIYRCKNDESLNSMIVGQFKPFSYEDAVKWVHGCMGEHDTYKFWAIATNDEEKRIIGWTSLSSIDYNNKSVHFHGIVIADKCYQDGFAWIETYLFIMDYCFEKLMFNRLTGSYISKHPMSGVISESLNFRIEGVFRESVCKNGLYLDETFVAILRDEYIEHLNNGDYEFYTIVSNIIKNKKNKRKNNGIK